MPLYDAHNHLQDERLEAGLGKILADTLAAGVVGMVVNGSCESDWPQVLALAREHPEVLPAFGYHPWYLTERTAEWRERLTECLDAVPSSVGEIGLDRWKEPYDSVVQEDVFLWQLRLAAERNLPASIHCLKAWGRLYDLLRSGPRPACGFLLHSYGGPVEMVAPLAKLGAYFSLPGYFAHERKFKQRETFRQVPRDRLLIETDAPDQCLPAEKEEFHLEGGPNGRSVNHPANLRAVHRFAAELLGRPTEELALELEENFLSLFGPAYRLRKPRQA